MRSDPPPAELVDYLSDSSFSAHKHATESLLRCLPLLPALDADTALAALDATEADLRNQRRQMRDSEGAARDRLRRAVDNSSRLQTGTVLEADQADEVRLVATDAGRSAVNGLKNLVSPLRVAKTEKEELAVAANLVGLLAEDKALDIVESAEALARARDVLNSQGNSAIELFEGDEAALGKARVCVAEQIDDLSSDLDDLVVGGASSSDASVVRMCLDAASKLSPALEASTVKAAVDAVVDFNDEANVISHGSGLMYGSSPSGGRSHSRDPEFFPGIDAAVAEALAPFREACHEAIERANDFCGMSASMFQDKCAACLLAIERLMHRVIVLPAHRVIEEFELALQTARERELRSSDDHVRSDGSSFRSSSPTLRFSRIGSRETVDEAETRYLDAVAAITCIVSFVDCELSGVAAANGVLEATCRSAMDSACSLVRPPLSMFVELETKWLKSRVAEAFAEIERVALASESVAVDPSYHRYRISHLKVAAKLPQMSHVAVSLCLASLRRCISALVSYRPGRNDADKVQALLGKLLQNAVAEFVGSVTLLVDRLQKLLPNDAAAAEHPDNWTRGASPLASVCKTIRYAHAGSKTVDSFLGSLQLSPSQHSTTSSPTSREWEEQIQGSISVQERRVAQLALRRGLEPIAASAHLGMQSAVAAVARRLAKLLSEGGGTTAKYVSPWGGDGSHEDDDPEPSFSFVSAAAFLEQELGVVHANLPAHNLAVAVRLLISATHDVVLRRWEALDGAIPARGGLQMAADGRALELAFERLAPEESQLTLLARYGLVFSTPRAELGAVIAAQLRPLADAQTLAALIGRRPDGSSTELSALSLSLVSPAGDGVDER